MSRSGSRHGLRRREFFAASSGITLAGLIGLGPAKSLLANENGPELQASVSTDAAVVSTGPGKVQGYVRRGVHTYKGVPYGKLSGPGTRFLPASEPDSWDGIRRTLTYGPVCPAGIAPKVDLSANEWPFMIPNGPVTSPMEDCLRVNIWTPTVDSQADLPVMFWLHADGFGGGSSQDFLSTDGEALARKENVVVCSINHRVGPLGFMNLSAIGGQKFAESGNAGMLDIVLALRWIKENIKGFGGNPDNVTIFGQSGGGFKISVLLAMPSAKGLFHKAIIQSGARIRVHDSESSESQAAALLGQFGLVPGPAAIESLQEMELKELFQAIAETSAALRKSSAQPPKWQSPNWWFEPTAGIKSLPSQPFDPSAPSVSESIPLICGTTLNEVSPSVNAPEIEHMNWDELASRLEKENGLPPNKAITAYREMNPAGSPADALSVLLSRKFRFAAVTLAERVVKRNTAPLWHYMFNWHTPVFEGRPRAFHTSDVAFVFHNTDLVDTQTGGGQRPRALADRMAASWAAFARSGNPNIANLPDWPAYNLTSRPTMMFDDTCGVEENFDDALLEIYRVI